MINIFVCIKQVPATNKVQIDEKTGVLKRTGVASKMNPYDLYALETALQLRDKYGGKVTVGTMGPPQAQAVIREAYLMGADEGYVFSDRKFGGADVLATGYTLSQAIRSIEEFDIILCGKQTTDGDTAQVGPSVAENLGIPHVAWVTELTIEGDGINAKQKLQDVIETIHIPMPCLITVEQDINMPRLPSLKRARETATKEIHVLGIQDFTDQDETHYGLAGSPTQVERIFPPDNKAEHEVWDDKEITDRLYEQLKKWKFV